LHNNTEVKDEYNEHQQTKSEVLPPDYL